MRTNFGLMQHHNWGLTEIENMIPWEREVYVELLLGWLEEEKERIKSEEAKMKNPHQEKPMSDETVKITETTK